MIKKISLIRPNSSYDCQEESIHVQSEREEKRYISDQTYENVYVLLYIKKVLRIT